MTSILTSEVLTTLVTAVNKNVNKQRVIIFMTTIKQVFRTVWLVVHFLCWYF